MEYLEGEAVRNIVTVLALEVMVWPSVRKAAAGRMEMPRAYSDGSHLRYVALVVALVGRLGRSSPRRGGRRMLEHRPGCR